MSIENTMPISKPGFIEPNRHGHVYQGKTTSDGYAVCSACDCVENTGEAASYCPVTSIGRELYKLTTLVKILSDPPMTMEQAKKELDRIGEYAPMEESEINRIVDAVMLQIEAVEESHEH